MVLSLWMIPRLTPLPPLLLALLTLLIRALTLDVFIRRTESSVTSLSTSVRARAVCVCALPTSALRAHSYLHALTSAGSWMVSSLAASFTRVSATSHSASRRWRTT